MDHPRVSSEPYAVSAAPPHRWLTAYRLPLTSAATAGFLLSLQTIWILRPGALCAVTTCISWSLATIGVHPGDLVLFVAGVVGLVRLFRVLVRSVRGRAAVFDHVTRPVAAVAALVALAIINTSESADPLLSGVGWLRIGAFLFALAGVPSWSVTVRRAFLTGFAVAMVGHALLGIVQFVTLEAQPSTLLGIAAHHAWTLGDSVLVAGGERWLRAYGGFPHPNVFGAALLVALAAFVALTGERQGEAAAGRGGGNGKARAVLLSCACCMFTVALVLSFSRAAWLGFVILLAALARHRATRPLAGVAAVVFVVFLLVFSPLVAPRFAASGPLETRSIVERRSAVTTSLSWGLIAPFGVGLHASPRTHVIFPRWLDPAVRDLSAPQLYAVGTPTHSVPLLAFEEIGYGGLVYLAIMTMGFWPRVLKLRPEHLALLPPLLFDHHLWSLPVGLALILVFAVAVLPPCWRLNRDRQS